MKLINKDHIVSIEIYREEESERFSIVEKRVKWFKKETKSVVRDNTCLRAISLTDFNRFYDRYLVINNTVYVKPHVKTNMSNNSTTAFWFENCEELDNWLAFEVVDYKDKYIEC
jgi:hypothetical protein